jgi:serine/threonine-protein phosphatase 2A activator
MIDKFPPIQQPMRFGNKAYKSWYENFMLVIKYILINLLFQEYDTLIANVIPTDKPDLAQEFRPYFTEAFGNDKRVDYGTGHELNFVCILLILHEVNNYSEEELRAMVHHVFYK